MRFTVPLIFILAVLSATPINAKPLHHFVYFGMDREKLQTTKSFLEIKQFEGAQVAYSWRQLEPGKDEYDFSLIREDPMWWGSFVQSNAKQPLLATDTRG